MSVAALEIQINNQVAQAYRAVSPESRERFQKLIALLVQEFTESTPRSLLSLMDEMGQEATKNGLTEELLESLLGDE